MAFELWLQAGAPQDALNTSDWPPTYLTFFERWPNAFEFYRHSVFAHLSWALGLAPWGQVLRSLLRRVRTSDPEGYADFREALGGAGERFRRQHESGQHLAISVSATQERDTRLTAGLQIYAAVYEIDLPLWFLGVVGNATRTGRVRPDYLGGPETKTHQGSLADAVASALRDTPLYQPFLASYDVDLRNTVGHNDWELTAGPDDMLLLTDHRSGRVWTEPELWDRIEGVQEMQFAVLLCAQLVVTDQIDPSVEFSDIGTLSFTAYVDEKGNLPTLLAPQLWCFRDLDPPGSWIDRCRLTLRVTEKGQGMTALTPNASASGQPYRGEVLERFRAHGWAKVVRIPVAPPAGLGLPTITTAEGEVFEVVGAPDEHVVPVDVLN